MVCCVSCEIQGAYPLGGREGGRAEVYPVLFSVRKMARVPYLSQDDLPAEYRHLFETDPHDPADVIVRAHRAVANNPTLFAAWGEWARTLYDEMGDARLR